MISNVLCTWFKNPLVSRRLLIQITEFTEDFEQRISILYFYNFLLKVHSTWSSNKKLILVHVVWVVTPDLPGANSGVPKAVSTRDRHTKTGSSLYWSRAPIHNDVFWQYFVWCAIQWQLETVHFLWYNSLLTE